MPLTILNCTYTSLCAPTVPGGQIDVATYPKTGARFERGRRETFEDFKARVELELNRDGQQDAQQNRPGLGG